MRVEIADPVAQYRGMKEEIDRAVIGVLESGRYILGENVRLLEAEIANFCNTKFAVGVNSGTDALLLSLMMLDISPEDEVIMPAFTIIVDASVVCLMKARPVFVDISPDTFNIDPRKIEEKISPRTKAIIVVHLYGQPVVDMDSVIEIAKEHKLKVIEDACQAIGAEYKGKKVGGLGDFGCFSFFPTKNLGTYGDGGMITINEQEISNKLRLLRAHGDIGQYEHAIIGMNSRLDEIHAAILRAKLRKINEWNERRREHAARFNEMLEGLNNIVTPREDKKCKHIYHQYTVRAQKRNELLNYLQQNNIFPRIYYPKPLHLQECLKFLGYKEGDFPQSEKTAKEVLSLPVYAEISNEQIDFVVQKVKEFYTK